MHEVRRRRRRRAEEMDGPRGGGVGEVGGAGRGEADWGMLPPLRRSWLEGGGMKKVALGGLGLDVAWARCGVESGSGLDSDDDARAVR